MKELTTMIQILGPSDVPVLLRGEPGVGKREAARRIHEAGARRDGLFVSVDGSLPEEEILECQLFGCSEGVRGHRAHPGKLEQAQGGTLYLPNVGGLPFRIQQRLWGAFSERRTIRTGGTESVSLNVRLISGSDKDLDTEVEMGRFCDDFHFHLQKVTLHIPPLRERKGALPRLAADLLSEIGRERGERPKVLTEEGVRLLRTHSWPGNLRELREVLEKAVLRAPDELLRLEDILLPEMSEGEGKEIGASLGETVERFFWDRVRGVSIQRTAFLPHWNLYHEVIREVERSMIASAIKIAAGNKLRAARILGITRTTFRKKMVEYGL